MIDRRKFLRRSVLGGGSVLFSSVLLESCTKYGIPLPGGNPNPSGPTIPPPLLGDDDIDWNDDAKTIVCTALSLVPEGGEILSALVNLFWPISGTDVWGQVRAQTEALLNKKIADDVYDRVTASLKGLNTASTDYFSIAKSTDLSAVQAQWILSKTTIDAAKDAFQQTGDEVLLLPLFAQYANMNLALYRDGAAFGKSWGWDDIFLNKVVSQLKSNIDEFTKYANDTYTNGLTNLQKATQTNYGKNEPFKTTNTFTRQMTLWVLDFMDTWQYYDVTLYPSGATVEFTREIYSDPFGNTLVFGGGTPQPIILPQPATQRPTQITVWGGSRIDAVQLTYPAGGGPGGVTQTYRMGDQNGGTNQPPHGGIFDIPLDNPIIQAQVSYDYTPINSTQVNSDYDLVVDTMFFMYNDGTTTNQMGKYTGPFKSGVVGYNYQALSSIYIQGVNANLKNSANCIIFGFLYWNPPAATLRAIGNIYITSPKERSVADFAKAFPKLGLSANSITAELKVARLAYWAAVKARQ